MSIDSGNEGVSSKNIEDLYKQRPAQNILRGMNDTSFASLMPPPMRQHSPLKGISTQSNVNPSTNQGSLDRFERERSEIGDRASIDRSQRQFGTSNDQLDAASVKSKIINKLQIDYKEAKLSQLMNSTTVHLCERMIKLLHEYPLS